MVSLYMNNREIRKALVALSRAMTIHVNRGVETRMNAMESTMPSRFKVFVRMNTPIFLVSKVVEDPQEFIDGVYKVLSAMRVTFRENVELGSYQLREVSKVWYTQWKDNRPVESGPIEWEMLNETFLGKYLPHERGEVKVEELINLSKAI